MSSTLRRNRWKLYLLFMIVIALCFGAYFFLLQPQFVEVSSKEDDLTNVKLELQRLEDERQQQQAGQDVQLLDHLQFSLPIEPQIAQIIRDIDSEEMRAELIMDSIRFMVNDASEGEQNHSGLIDLLDSFMGSTPVPTNETQEDIEQEVASTITFQISFSAWDDGFDRFMSAMLDRPRIYTVESFQYVVIEEEQGQRVDGTMTISAYYVEQFASFVQSEQ